MDGNRGSVCRTSDPLGLVADGNGRDHPHFERRIYHAWKRAKRIAVDAGYDCERHHEPVQLTWTAGRSFRP